MRRLAARLGGLAFVLLLGEAAIAQEAPTLTYQTFTLDNGLDVILVEDHTAPVVTVDTWYHVGGANDPEGRSGFAHLFEHMMFQGTANLTKDALQRLVTDVGGEFNAYTALDQTAYHVTLPAHELPLGLWLEADRMASLAITQTNLDNQRAVVIQEYQQNYSGNPYGLALRDASTLPYSYDPYRRSPIGAVDEVNQATVAEIKAFHDLYYVPNNATLVIAGDFDEATARELIDRYFAPIPAGEEPPALPAYEPVQRLEAETITVNDSLIRIPATFVAYEIPPRQDPDYPALQVLTQVLSMGDSSRMTRDLVDTGLALAASVSIDSNVGPGLVTAVLIPNLGSISREELEQLFYDQLDRILAEGATEEELAKAINTLRTGTLMRLETSFGLAEQVQTANLYYRDPGAVFTEIERFAGVTSEDIQRVIREYLAPEDRFIVKVDPAPAAAYEQPQPFVGATGTPADDAFEVDFALPYAEPPEPLPISEFSLPPVVDNTLPNGLKVMIVQNDEVPMISLDLVFRGGAALAPLDVAGLEGATASLLTRGTSTMSAQEIASAIENRGGVTGGYSSNDFIGVGMIALAEDSDFAFGLLADMALDPIFPQEEIDVLKAQMMTQLEAALSSPGAQASRAFFPRLYPDHPYGTILTNDAVAGLTRDAIIAYYDTVADPANAILIVSGDISPDEAMALAERYFGDWEGGGTPPAISYPPLDNGIAGTPIYLVDVPGAQQAELAIGNLGVRGDNPDRYSLSVLNTLLGDGLSSRLGRNLRERRGYAYSIGSTLTFPVDRGVFEVTTRVQPGTVADAITQILHEISVLQTEPIPEDELADVKAGMIGRFALDLETTGDYVGVVAAYTIRGLPLSDIADYPDRIAAVTPDIALEAADEYLPHDMLIVVAGDADVLQPLLETLGPVTVLQPQ